NTARAEHVSSTVFPTSGSKALEYSNGIFDCQSPTSPFMGSLRALHLVEDLRGLLEMMEADEKEGLRCQVPDSTAEALIEWLQSQMTNGHIAGNGDLYQERLGRLENDKESLVLQVSVLTDQVEAQGEKIRDLEFCLEEHREKLNATEEMLQQELLSRTSLETQKLNLMAEISNLKLKLTAVEKDQLDYEDRYGDTEGLMQEINELRLRVGEMDNERLQYEKKLKSTKVSYTEGKRGEMGVSCKFWNCIFFKHPEVLGICKSRAFVLKKQTGYLQISYQVLISNLNTEVQESSDQGPGFSTISESHRITAMPGMFLLFSLLVLCPQLLILLLPRSPQPRLWSILKIALMELSADEKVQKLLQLISRFHSVFHVCDNKGIYSWLSYVKDIKCALPPLLRLKRSQSTTFNPDDMSEAEFKRGGTRATAGPRLGWSRDLGQSNGDLDMPFAKWTKEQVCNWLQGQGLGSYMNHGKHWILSGQTLLQASQQDLEKELGIKHPLHRKKLQLALQALGSEEENNHGKLDYNWVTRWLDDIGLPQYKTQFDEGRVDGRMLHYMSVDDLLSLKVVSVLHHLSIKRAIQVLRINNFEPNCLRRRPSDENNITPSEVTQWTNHRVMEWLRSVDLAEYAPNLRGSGVHGGLMVLEPRFNVETMAQLLNIPPNKTLLRRHLATHFNLLVGQDAQHQKREAMESPDYVLLTATAKVKPKKLAFSNFGSLRKKKQDDVEEYVCPMELGQASGSGSKKGFKAGLDIRVYDDDDLDRLEQVNQLLLFIFGDGTVGFEWHTQCCLTPCHQLSCNTMILPKNMVPDTSPKELHMHRIWTLIWHK
uniref:PPFIA binding protein 1 n=1 Tax=Chelydra serpentina TaxID=8475 RepID=A0A8C3T2M8_CHESE